MRMLVIAPHPDDETLGVGGTLLKRKREGVEIGWLIVTEMTKSTGWDESSISHREDQIQEIVNFFGFDFVHRLGFSSTSLDQVPRATLVSSFTEVIKAFGPTDVFVPHPSDAHSDHRVTFEVCASATKWFRASTVKRIFLYETLSETGAGLNTTSSFKPNFFINIESHLKEKLDGLAIYKSELGSFPFPRSIQSIEALARMRGSHSGFLAAEAFELIRAFEE